MRAAGWFALLGGETAVATCARAFRPERKTHSPEWHTTRARFSRRGLQKINGVGAGSAREWEKTPSYYRLCSLLGSEQKKPEREGAHTQRASFTCRRSKSFCFLLAGLLDWDGYIQICECPAVETRRRWNKKFINLGPNLGKYMLAVSWYSKTFRKKTALCKSTPFLRGLLFSSSSWAQLPRQIEARSAERKRCMSESLLESVRPAAQLGSASCIPSHE